MRQEGFQKNQPHQVYIKNKKKTIEEIIQLVESRGYKLLSSVYKNIHTKLKFRCLKGHEFTMRYDSFQGGQNCPICMRKVVGQKLRRSIEEIQEYIRSRGYKWVSGEYQNNSSILELRCSEGHLCRISWGSFHNGVSCPICTKKIISEKFRKSFKEVQKFINNQGYKWISGEYKNEKSKLILKCSNGHVFETSFRSGIKCSICIKINKEKKMIKKIKLFAKEHKCELLSITYTNGYENLSFRCLKKHKFETSWYKFQQGSRCPICIENNRKKKILEEIIQFTQERGYTLLSTVYKNAGARLRFKCPEGHKFMMRWDGFQRGANCPICTRSGRVDLTYESMQERYPFFCVVEEIRECSVTGELQVRCANHNCPNSKEKGGWFTPTKKQLFSRANAVQKDVHGVSFYCSENCKNNCRSYKKSVSQLIKEDKIRAGYIPEPNYTITEYNIWREEVLRRQRVELGYNECEYCDNRNINELDVHHEKPQKTHPHLALDPDNGIIVCGANSKNKCHYKYGHKAGTECSTSALANKVCTQDIKLKK